MMKQYITDDQLQEISLEQQIKLHKLIRGDIQRHPFLASEVTIGKMIEILDPKEETIFTMCKMVSANPPIYEITVNGDYYYGENMCDALWEAVKSILVK